MQAVRVDGDLTTRSPKAVACRRLVLADEGEMVVAHVMHGVWQRWHHIEVEEGDDEVVVTAYVGTLPDIADRQAQGESITFVLKGVVHPVALRLSTPLGTRQLRDGAKDDPVA